MGGFMRVVFIQIVSTVTLLLAALNVENIILKAWLIVWAVRAMVNTVEFILFYHRAASMLMVIKEVKNKDKKDGEQVADSAIEKIEPCPPHKWSYGPNGLFCLKCGMLSGDSNDETQ